MIRLLNKRQMNTQYHLVRALLPGLRGQYLHTGNNKKIYTDAKIETSDDELMKKIVI